MDMQRAVTQRRLGEIEIDRHLIKYASNDVMLLLSRILVVSATDYWASNSIKYIGYSPEFDETPEGSAPPSYRPTFRTEWHDDGSGVTRRIESIERIS
ncbi:MAG: hypothetical protein AB7U75_14940 [Hyphomicrobiaceae bacterium]